ncbi:sigma-70 family RNA polymerase sigma factor [soil metagenome]
MITVRTRGRDIDDADLAALVGRMALGDQAALAQLYDATAARAYGLCRRVLGSAQVAEEVTSVSYQAIWDRAAEFDVEHGTAQAWVLAIVHRAAVDRVRSEPNPGVDSFDTLDLCDAPRANAALAALSTLEWAAVEHAYFAGRRHAEVAALLGVTPQAAQARIRQGLLRLADLAGTG